MGLSKRTGLPDGHLRSAGRFMPMNVEDRADGEYWHAGRLLREDKVQAAHTRVLTALDLNPDHELATMLLGEISLWYHEELGVEPLSAYREALELFEKVIRREPRHAEARSQKALALIYLERFGDALDAAEKGLEVLPLRIRYAMSGPEVFTN